MWRRPFPVFLLLSLSGCATVFHGTRQSIEVSSQPSGATVTADGQRVITPGVLRLPRKARTIELHFSREGFQNASFSLTRRASNTVWWNLTGIPIGAVAGGSVAASRSSFSSGWGNGIGGAVAGGLIAPAVAFGIDFATGAAFALTPARVHVQLRPLESQ